VGITVSSSILWFHEHTNFVLLKSTRKGEEREGGREGERERV
jgi:hypothetical protein